MKRQDWTPYRSSATAEQWASQKIQRAMRSKSLGGGRDRVEEEEEGKETEEVDDGRERLSLPPSLPLTLPPSLPPSPPPSLSSTLPAWAEVQTE